MLIRAFARHLIELIAYRDERSFDVSYPLKMRFDGLHRFHDQPYNYGDDGKPHKK
jgi:hypothetical protein